VWAAGVLEKGRMFDMPVIEGSETSAKHNLTPGKHPKEHTQDSKYLVYIIFILATCFGVSARHLSIRRPDDGVLKRRNMLTK
jgi:hypothetical protein